MALLTREQVKDNPPKIRFKELMIPEWNGSVRIRSLSAGDKESLDDTLERDNDGTIVNEGLREKYIVAAVINEDGSQFFSDEDLKWLSTQPESVIAYIFSEVNLLNRPAAKNS